MNLSRWYHSIRFISVNQEVPDRDTWEDWHLIPVTRPVVDPPSLKTTIVEMPGVDGEIDLSDFLDPYPVYTNRKGSWEFAVKNGFKPWDVLYSEIMNYFGKRNFYVILQDDLAYRYKGKLSVNQWESDPSFSVITIDYNLEPYKQDRLGSADQWEWDIFDFVTGYISDYARGNAATSGWYIGSTSGTTGHVKITNNDDVPTFFDYVYVSSGPCDVTISNSDTTVKKHLVAGNNDISSVIFPVGDTDFNFENLPGTINVKISYRGKSL